jgi:hypothetical protein
MAQICVIQFSSFAVAAAGLSQSLLLFIIVYRKLRFSKRGTGGFSAVQCVSSKDYADDDEQVVAKKPVDNYFFR